MNLDPCISPYTKLKFKRIKHLNIKIESLNLLEDKIRKILEDTSMGKDFLKRAPVAKEITKGELM